MVAFRLLSSIPLVLLAFLFIVPLHARQQTQQGKKKPNIAVLDFDARTGLSKGEAESFSDVFQSQLVETGEFVVIDRARTKAILLEQGFQQSEACSQVECIVEAGKILKVEKMFAGVVSKVGKTYTVNIQLIDISSAQIQLSKSRQHVGEIDDLVSSVIPELAAEMAETMLGKKVKTSVVSSGGSSSWYWYVGGAVLAGGGVAALLLGSTKPGQTTQKPTSLPDPSNFP